MAKGGVRRLALLGGAGYVAGEVLRLVAGHPALEVGLVTSSSRVGERVGEVFPHLAGTTVSQLEFGNLEELPRALAEGRVEALISALPHGEAAPVLAEILALPGAEGLAVVDLSADFRFAAAVEYEAFYGHRHPAPALCPTFTCAVPEHFRSAPPRRVAHPGCFATAVALAAYPFVAAGLTTGPVFAAAVTGSSGAGRTPTAGTHHPERRSNLYAYSPLAHRHQPEIARLLAPANGGQPAEVELVTLSGPLARGIHATVRLTLNAPLPAGELSEVAARCYARSPFLTVSTTPPRLTQVVGTNRCQLGVASRGHTAVVTAVLDNLVKGAAGGGVQWLNRMLGLDESAGLRQPGLGWL